MKDSRLFDVPVGGRFRLNGRGYIRTTDAHDCSARAYPIDIMRAVDLANGEMVTYSMYPEYRDDANRNPLVSYNEADGV